MAEFDQVARELVLLFRSLKGLHRTILSEAGLRLEMPAAAVLATLEDRGQQRLSSLAEALHLELSSASRQVAGLEREGWVRRERDPADSRAALLDLTEQGRAVLGRVRDARIAHLARRLPDWSPLELQQFADQLSRFRHDLTAEPEAPAGEASDAAPLSHPSAPPPDPDRTDQTPALAGRRT